MKYLLDTNIIIFWLKDRYGIPQKSKEIGPSNCFVSEVTVAELRFGVECSEPDLLDEKRNRLAAFLTFLQIIPFSTAIERYASEEARLRTAGEVIPDFDLLIGATAIQEGMKMVTNNFRHLSKMKDIDIEDWTQR